jgi:hypothetical protein
MDVDLIRVGVCLFDSQANALIHGFRVYGADDFLPLCLLLSVLYQSVRRLHRSRFRLLLILLWPVHVLFFFFTCKTAKHYTYIYALSLDAYNKPIEGIKDEL